MTNQRTAQQLIELIYEALNRRELALCEQYLVELEAFGGYQDWVDLGRATRDVMCDHDLGKAERAITAILARQLGDDVRGRATIALGKIYFQQGNWQKAAVTSGAALPFFAHDPVEQARILQNMAVMYRRDFDQAESGALSLRKALDHALQARDLLETVAEPSDTAHHVQGLVWNTLGTIYLNQAHWDEALTCYQRKLAICRQRTDRQGIAESTKNIGEILHKQGQWGGAITHYQQALAYFQEVHNLSELMDTQANLATLYQEQTNPTQALIYYDAALQTSDQLRRAITGTAARTTFAATVAEIYANAILFCVETGRTAQAFNYVEQARARALLDLLAGEQPAPSDDITIDASVGANAAIRPTTLADVQAKLPMDALLLVYFTTGLYESTKARVSAREKLIRHRFPREATLLFAVTRTQCTIDELEIAPNSLLRAQLDDIALRHVERERQQPTLYTALLAPVDSLLRSKRQVYLIPHGPLHYVPFHALPDPAGNPFLADTGPTLTYAPSASFLVRDRHQSASSKRDSCLAIGYNSGREEATAALYFAEAEAQAVIQAIGGKVWIGPAAKKVHFFAHAHRYRYLHFACHGHFAAAAPMNSWLEIGHGEVIMAQEVLEQLRVPCDLVVLSACESGARYVHRGDELMGFIRAFMVAGASALLITLWQVDDLATYLFMQTFYEQLGQTAAPASALRTAQQTLRQLTRHEVRQKADQLVRSQALRWDDPRLAHLLTGAQHEPAYADPKYWAAFVLIGGLAPDCSVS